MADSALAPRSGSGALLVLGSCLSLQFGASLAYPLFAHASTWGVTAVRLAVAAAILLAVARPAVRRWDRATWLSVAAMGLALGAMNGFFYAAIARLPLGIAVTIEFLGPLLLAAALSRRARDLGWVVLAFCGIGLLGLDSLVTTNVLDPVGVALVLCAAGMWALYILAGARVSTTVPGMGGLAVAFAVGAAFNAVPGLSGAGTILADPALLWPAVGVGVLGSLVPFSLELLALRRLSKPVFGVLLALEPVCASLIGWLVLGQALGALQWGAVAAVIAATVGNTVSSSREARTTTPVPATRRSVRARRREGPGDPRAARPSPALRTPEASRRRVRRRDGAAARSSRRTP